MSWWQQGAYLLPSNIPKVELKVTMLKCLDVEPKRRGNGVNVFTIELLQAVESRKIRERRVHRGALPHSWLACRYMTSTTKRSREVEKMGHPHCRLASVVQATDHSNNNNISELNQQQNARKERAVCASIWLQCVRPATAAPMCPVRKVPTSVVDLETEFDARIQRNSQNEQADLLLLLLYFLQDR